MSLTFIHQPDSMSAAFNDNLFSLNSSLNEITQWNISNVTASVVTSEPYALYTVTGSTFNNLVVGDKVMGQYFVNDTYNLIQTVTSASATQIVTDVAYVEDETIGVLLRVVEDSDLMFSLYKRTDEQETTYTYTVESGSNAIFALTGSFSISAGDILCNTNYESIELNKLFKVLGVFSGGPVGTEQGFSTTIIPSVTVSQTGSIFKMEHVKDFIVPTRKYGSKEAFDLNLKNYLGELVNTQTTELQQTNTQTTGSDTTTNLYGVIVSGINSSSLTPIYSDVKYCIDAVSHQYENQSLESYDTGLVTSNLTLVAKNSTIDPGITIKGNNLVYDDEFTTFEPTDWTTYNVATSISASMLGWQPNNSSYTNGVISNTAYSASQNTRMEALIYAAVPAPGYLNTSIGFGSNLQTGNNFERLYIGIIMANTGLVYTVRQGTTQVSSPALTLIQQKYKIIIETSHTAALPQANMKIYRQSDNYVTPILDYTGVSLANAPFYPRFGGGATSGSGAPTYVDYIKIFQYNTETNSYEIVSQWGDGTETTTELNGGNQTLKHSNGYPVIISGDINQITQLQITGSVSSSNLYIPSEMTNLEKIYVTGSNSIYQLHLSGQEFLISSSLNNVNLASASIDTDCYRLKYVDYSNNRLDVNSVNAVLVNIDSIGRTSGSLLLAGGTNGTPTGAGNVATGSLLTKGWNLTTN